VGTREVRRVPRRTARVAAWWQHLQNKRTTRRLTNWYRNESLITNNTRFCCALFISRQETTENRRTDGYCSTRNTSGHTQLSSLQTTDSQTLGRVPSYGTYGFSDGPRKETDNTKAKLSRYTPWRRLRGEKLYALLTSALDGGERSASRPGRTLDSAKGPPCTHWTGGWLGLRTGLDTEARGKILCLCRGSNLDRLVIQSVLRHHTDWVHRMFRAVFWVILPCKMIVDRRFRGAYCLHHQGTWNLTEYTGFYK
jgi:hypothetical protein